MLASMSLEGMGSSLAVEGATTSAVFETYVELVFAQRGRQRSGGGHGQPKRPQGGERIRELIGQRGCELLYLPSYSPDLNPIEQAFSKLKSYLREACARGRERLMEVIPGEALSTITVSDAESFFGHCGYRTVVQSL